MLFFRHLLCFVLEISDPFRLKMRPKCWVVNYSPFTSMKYVLLCSPSMSFLASPCGQSDKILMDTLCCNSQAIGDVNSSSSRAARNILRMFCHHHQLSLCRFQDGGPSPKFLITRLVCRLPPSYMPASFLISSYRLIPCRPRQRFPSLDTQVHHRTKM